MTARLFFGKVNAGHCLAPDISRSKHHGQQGGHGWGKDDVPGQGWQGGCRDLLHLTHSCAQPYARCPIARVRECIWAGA